MRTSDLIYIVFISTLIDEILNYIVISMGLSFDATYIYAFFKVISLIALILIFLKTKLRRKITKIGYLLFSILLVWNIINLIRGLMNYRDYWDLKYLLLANLFNLLTPLLIVVGIYYLKTARVHNFIVKKGFIYGYIIIPFTSIIDETNEFFSRTIAVNTWFYILILPYLKKRIKIIIIIAVAVSFIIAFDHRSNMLRIVIASSFVTLYFLKSKIHKSIINIMAIFIFVLPLIFVILGLTGQYNIFKPDVNNKKVIKNKNNKFEGNLTADTRTFLYIEVLSSMYEKNTFLLGEGGCGSYNSPFFGRYDPIIKAHGRYTSEVGFLNTLLHTGILGVIIYLFILMHAVYLGINKSKNFLCKLFALFIAFRWILFFIEDYTKLDLNYFYHWMTIGMCFSKEFRNLSDNQLKTIFTSFFKTKKVSLQVD